MDLCRPDESLDRNQSRCRNGQGKTLFLMIEGDPGCRNECDIPGPSGLYTTITVKDFTVLAEFIIYQQGEPNDKGTYIEGGPGCRNERDIPGLSCLYIHSRH